MPVRLQDQPFDAGAELALFSSSLTDSGAVVSFTGLCRSLAADGERLVAMTLEHYPGMAQAALESIEGQACERWPLERLLLVHRFGRMVPGDPIVLVLAASKHRAAAFAAAEFAMDYLKTHAPFWKLEETADGAEWVASRQTDDAAAARW